MLSRIENILQSIVDSSEYDGPVQSRIEQLLLDVKSVISAGGSGGVTEATVSTMISASINSLIDSAPDEYNTLGKIAAHLLLTDEQIRTITEQVNDRYTKEETNELVSKIPKFTIEVVTSLPTENISTTTVYLKTGSKSDPNNIYDEYIYVKSKWELLGSQTIDLSGYVTTDELTTALENKVDNTNTGANSLLSKLPTTFTDVPLDDTYFIRQDVGNKMLFGRVEFSTLWTYIKSKADTKISTTSTNYVQNKAVGLKFQGVDSEISGINSSLTEKTAEIAMIVNEYGSKNLLSLTNPPNKVNATGIDVSFISNGGIWVHGTKTTDKNGDIYYRPNVKTTLKPNTKYTLTSVNSSPNAMTVRMHLIADDKIIYIGNNKSNVNKTSITFTTPNASNIYVKEYAITVTNNNPIDVSVYPMLRYAAIKDDTYVPYAMTNRELTEKVADTGWITTGNLKYRKSGYIVALQGSVTPSGSTMSITLGILPNDCRPSQDINIAQAYTDTPLRRIIVHTDGNVVLLFESNCTENHAYSYNGIFMV